MDTYRNTAAIYVRRSAANERDVDDLATHGHARPLASSWLAEEGTPKTSRACDAGLNWAGLLLELGRAHKRGFT